MAYPTSSDVSAGQPTASAHYNNLRADALRLGAVAADGINIGALFSKYSDGLTLTLLGTNRVRVAASTTAPVSIVIDGVPLQAVNNIDLAVGDAPSGAANTYYVFALRSAGFTSFTLDVNTSAVEAAGRRLIGSFYWDGTQIVEQTIHTNQGDFIAALLSHVDPTVCEGRITVSSGVPVPTAAASGGTVYFTPYLGCKVALYLPSLDLWKLYHFDEISASLAGKAVGTYDIFIYDDGDNLALEVIAWSTSTVRATALAVQDGVYVKTGALDHRFLGTIYLQVTATLYDDDVRRFVWNHYNRVHRRLFYQSTTNSWTETTQGWRPLEDVNFRVNFVVGLDNCLVEVMAGAMCKVNSGGSGAMFGICLDAADNCNSQFACYTTHTVPSPMTAQYTACPGTGMHFLQAVEGGNAATPNLTYYGDNGIAGLAACLAGFMFG